MSKMMRNVCLTINNYTPEDIKSIDAFRPECRYMVVGVELSDSNTPHLQCYFQLARRLSFNTIQKQFRRAHIEPARGTAKENYQYCTKGGDYWEYGELKTPGRRTDLALVADLAKDPDRSLLDIVEDSSLSLPIQSFKILKELKEIYEQKKRNVPYVIWLFGRSGSGKTSSAYDALPDAYFKTPGSLKWWPNYKGEQDIIIDDFRPNSGDFIRLLSILDRYPCQVEYKGGMKQFYGDFIIITSPRSVESTFSQWEFGKDYSDEDITQIHRRVNEEIEINEKTKPYIINYLKLRYNIHKGVTGYS
jgi:hypothetical protein